ncbi:MAG: hypothetical protein Kow0068_07380 [Marinilabiliales bacterium]
MKNNTIIYSLIKIIVIAGCFVYIGKKLYTYNNELNFNNIFTYINKNSLYFVLILLLMPINWSFESIKWKFLIKNIKIISFPESLKAVLCGITASMITPNRVGEIAGRVFSVKNKRKDVLFSTVTGSISQLSITIIFGLAGLILFFYLFPDKTILSDLYRIGLIILFIILIFITFYLYFNIKLIDKLLKKIKWFHKIHNAASILSAYNRKELLVVLLFSSIRYMIFVMQYKLLFSIFELETSLIETYIIISATYLISSLLPSFTVVEFGIRGSVIIFFTEIFYADYTGAFISSVFMWLINLAIPAIIGSYFVLKLKS